MHLPKILSPLSIGKTLWNIIHPFFTYLILAVIILIFYEIKKKKKKKHDSIEKAVGKNEPNEAVLLW